MHVACCNHCIDGDIDINVYGGSDCTFSCFIPADFADEENTISKLMVKLNHTETGYGLKHISVHLCADLLFMWLCDRCCFF